MKPRRHWLGLKVTCLKGLDMPMKSKKQRAFLHANKPKVAKKFESETPKGAKLPTRKSRAAKSKAKKK